MKGLRYMTIVPVLMMLASVIAGCYQYGQAKSEMRQDLNQALHHLVLDLSQRKYIMDSIASLHDGLVLTLDDRTQLLGSRLSIAPLKDTCHLSICLNTTHDKDLFAERAFISSDTLLWTTQQTDADEVVIALKAFANPSFCSVMGHSHQHYPIAGFLLGLVMLAAMLHRISAQIKVTEALTLVGQEYKTAPNFPSITNLRLTPMQRQLMDLFAAAPGYTLSKDDICAALWPKKDNPDDTLYTFISRLKSTLRKQSNLHIVNDRGRQYTLTNNNETH